MGIIVPAFKRESFSIIIIYKYRYDLENLEILYSLPESQYFIYNMLIFNIFDMIFLYDNNGS